MTRKAEFGDCKLLDSASISDDSDGSVFSWSTDSLEDDASSSSNSSSGPLSDLSLLMANLPIKRGLSQFFQGKSQSFTSLSEASCIQDLAKKASNCIKRVKYSKINGGLHMNQKKHYALNVCSRAISKKGLMYSCDSMLARNRSSNLFDSSSHITEKDIEFVLK